MNDQSARNLALHRIIALAKLLPTPELLSVEHELERRAMWQAARTKAGQLTRVRTRLPEWSEVGRKNLAEFAQAIGLGRDMQLVAATWTELVGLGSPNTDSGRRRIAETKVTVKDVRTKWSGKTPAGGRRWEELGILWAAYL